MPQYYWAEFINIGSDIFRFDTRIYLNPIGRIKPDDKCIGAVVGKNPGSAKPTAIGCGIQSIALDGDRLLPTVRNIITKSYSHAKIHPPKNGYIQVLNLFYLCDPNLGQALKKIKANNKARNCPTENHLFPWVWYVWGGALPNLSTYKERFSELNSNNHFYYDKSLLKIVEKPASKSTFAKHTQGLKQELVFPYISSLMKNG